MMGLISHAAKVLMRERARKPFSGSLLMLGHQDVCFSYKTLTKIARQFHQELVPCPLHLSSKEDMRSRQYISAETLFKSLGFQEVRSMDISDYENADYLFDLNNPEIPLSLKESFDVVLDGGTIEHVFNIPNALNNIFTLLKKNGRIIHISPSSNYMDHGFYMFSPTLFWDFYEANEYDINLMQIIRTTRAEEFDGWKLSHYFPGALNRINFGGLDSSIYAILTIATKTNKSTGTRIPQQYIYSKQMWNKEDFRKKTGVLEKLKNKLRKNASTDRFFWVLKKCYMAFKKKGLGLKVADRY